MFFTVSEGIKELCNYMVANPHDWVQTDYEFANKTHRDIRIWTASGLCFIKLNGNDGLSLAEKALVLRSIKLAIARRISHRDMQ